MKQSNHDSERAVSPVIGVILMVAITVILAAVIASFVLGLGDQNDPAPTPNFDSDYTPDELELSKVGGTDFEAASAEIEYRLNVTNFDTSSSEIVEGTTQIDQSDTQTLSGFDNGGSDDLDVTYTTNIPGDEVVAGDTMTFGFGSAPTDDIQIVEWEVDVIWNPADGDSEIVYSDSS